MKLTASLHCLADIPDLNLQDKDGLRYHINAAVLRFFPKTDQFP